MNAPAITVLMTVYNGRKLLAEAIESILVQTHRDFELLIINDGSTDDSLALLRTYADPRIRIIDQQPNRGIHHTLNRGLHEARGRYVAIMDQDDIAMPRRLERLYSRMEAQPDLALCGSAIETFGYHPVKPWVRYFEPDALKVALLFENPICHPSVMLRRSNLADNGLQYPDMPYAEEYCLWVTLSRLKPIANHPEPLLRYRSHPQQVSRLRNEIQCASMDLVILDQLKTLGLHVTARQLAVHKLLGGGFNPMPGYTRRLRQWSALLIAANRERKVYNETEFARQLAARTSAALSLHKQRLNSLGWLRRLGWRFATARDFMQAQLPTANPAPKKQ